MLGIEGVKQQDCAGSGAIRACTEAAQRGWEMCWSCAGSVLPNPPQSGGMLRP